MSGASEIIKSGAADKIADIIHLLSAPLAEQVGQLLGDVGRELRVRNLIAVTRRTDRKLYLAGLTAKDIPLRILQPLLEAASVESDPTLQSMWGGLLATASQAGDSLSPGFSETLKNLTPLEARILQAIFEDIPENSPQEQWCASFWVLDTRYAGIKVPVSLCDPDELVEAIETFDRIGLGIQSFDPAGFLSREELTILFDAFGEPEDGGALEVRGVQMNRYGMRFLRACNGPAERLINKKTRLPL